ncbi:MAG: hypothetical protein KA116_00550 [Proteobacteria bacterium]|nr:hypothetical protein [Pseudomonadota bacterium]
MSIYVLLLLICYVIRLWLSTFSGIHPDEAYYWTWAQNLHMGYFDHPPMIAWIIALGQKTFCLFSGQSFPKDEFWLQISFRWLPYFFSTVLTPYFLGLSIRLYQRRLVSFTQGLAILSTPIFCLGPHIITPDSVFFFGWVLCLYGTMKVRKLRPKDAAPDEITPFSLKHCLFMGFALAFAAYSKFTAILLIFLYALSGAGLWNTLGSGLTALILCLPYFYWTISTAAKKGIGIFFQFQNGMNPFNSPVEWSRVGDLILAQFVLWGPLVILYLIYFSIGKLRRRAWLILWTIAPLIFFSIGALRRPAEANWALVGAIPALVIVISDLSRKAIQLSYLSISNFLTIFLGLIILINGALFAPIFEKSYPRISEKLSKPSRINEFRGWKRFREFVFEASRDDQAPILVDRYQVLSPLLFFDSIAAADESLGERLKIWNEGGSRKSQFTIEERYQIPQGTKNYWILLDDLSKIPANCRFSQSLFRGVEDIHTYHLLKCSIE